MLGLAHRGYRLADSEPAHRPRAAGGGLHVDADRRAARRRRTPRTSATTSRRLEHRSRRGARGGRVPRRVRRRAVLPVGRLLRDPPAVLRADLGTRRALSLPPAHLPDTPETRRDMARFVASARALDAGRRHRARGGRGRGHARDPHHRPRARVPRREGDADRPRDRRDADPARPGRLRGRPRVRRARLPARPVPDDLRAGRDRDARWCARPLAAHSGERTRRGVCGDDVPRRVRAAARGAHEAVQVHPSLRHGPDPCSRTSTTARARTTCSPHGLAERAVAAEELYDLVLDLGRPSTSPATRRTRRRWPRCASGSSAGWRRPATRCSHGRVEPPPGAELNLPEPALARGTDGGGAMTGLVIQTQADAPAGLLAAGRRGEESRSNRAGRPGRAGPSRATTRSRSRSAPARRRAATGRRGSRARSSGCAPPTPRACRCSASASARRRWPRRWAARCTGSRSPRSAGSGSRRSDADRLPEGPWMAWHEDGFTLPPLAYELARNAFGVQAFCHCRHLAVQFHPEVTAAIVADWARGRPRRPASARA